MNDLPPESEKLLAVSPDDFVEERKRVVKQLRDEGKTDEAEETSARLPHRQKYLLLNVAFVRRLLDLHEELLGEVEREFDGTQPAVS